MSHRYLISDAEHNPIAKAVLESPPGTQPLHLHVMDGLARQVEQTGELCLIAMYDADLTFRGRVGYRYGDCVVVSPTEELSIRARQNLRVPVEFASYLYPVSGAWRGRCALCSKDLSCGGIAFRASQQLDIGETVETVIAVMKHPLVVQAQILRALPPVRGDRTTYSAKFCGLCDDEVKAIRKTVFSLQLKGHDCELSVRNAVKGGFR